MAVSPKHPVIGVFGPPCLRVEGRWQQPPTRQVGRVLTVLAGWPQEPVPAARIVEALWGDDHPDTVENTLQVHISHLRRWLGKERVEHHDGSYLLVADPSEVDTFTFEANVHSAMHARRAGRVDRAVDHLGSALALVRGAAYAHVHERDLRARQARLEEMADQAREDLLECRLEVAEDAMALSDVIASAREQVARHPMRESSTLILMRALMAAGRSPEATQAFDDLTAGLSSQGFAPSASAAALVEQCRGSRDMAAT